MAKISLRIYNKEIERLIELGGTDEAVAHCRHILATFPKHLETYRLLGKAFLESKHYAEAIDVFGRVLMAVPDDFVSHVGLSIIRDEENKLDDSIWHMERAFEAQPSNAAIQGELQRLYGRRDGMEPPKVRMTRGALAHMYVQGELYPQAIAEIRAVLAQDAQRSDMQVLLALSYSKSGQKSDASDICNQLLKRYPYCFDANRIMVELLPATTETAESTQVYRMRVGELDPYALFNRGSVFLLNEVPDASVNLERLEYAPEEASLGEAWSSSLGAGFDASASPALGASSSNDQPDWLKGADFSDGSSSSFDASQPTFEAGSASQAGGEIPEFLRAAGWNESNTPEQPSSIFDEEPAADLTPANIPDWLKDQAPASDALARITEPRSDEIGSMDSPDWLNNLDGSQSTESSASPMSASDTPDWLSGLGGSEPAPQPAGDVPDWLSGLGGPASQDSAAEEDSQVASETPDWLSGLAGNKPDDGPAQPANIPDWLSAAEPKVEPAASPSIESLGATTQEQDDAVAWLESLAAKHGAKPEELVTDPNLRNEHPPEWVTQAQNINQPPAAAQIKVEDLGTTAAEQDDAVAWLESLAAKHGAKPEELVTDPNKRSDTPPDWVQKAQSAPVDEPAKQERVEGAANIGEQFFAEFENSAREEQPAVDETGIWLRGLEDEKKQESPLAENENQPSGLPEWLNRSEPAEAASPESSIPFEEKKLDDNDLSDWLKGLDDEPGLDFSPEILQAADRPPIPNKLEKRVDTQPAKDELPDWLTSVEAESESESEAEDDAWIGLAAASQTDEPSSAGRPSVSLTADLPDWLQGVDDDEPGEAEKAILPSGDQVEEDEQAPWLQRERWEAESMGEAEPKPTSPSDWRPIGEANRDAGTPVKAVASGSKPGPISAKSGKPIMEYPPKPRLEDGSLPSGSKKKRSGTAARGGPVDVNLLNQAKSELERGDIPAALENYGKLIKKGKHLEESVRDLTESINRYPVEVGIWQTLGDAYMRANRLKEALEAYNKAEELIR